jgi:membrane protease YdiL (CAAX protease family)
MSSRDDRRAVPVYLLITFALSSVFYFLIIKSGHLGAGAGMYVVALMWCPASAAMLTSKYLGRQVGSLGWKWGNARYQVMSYVIPLAYATITYSIVWLTGLGGVYDKKFVAAIIKSFGLGALPPWAAIALYFLFAGTAGMVRSCATALGEEIGWRGFLVPALAERFSFTATAFISGCIWAVWHYPVLIFADYNAGTPTWYGLTCFTVMVIAMSFIFAWMRLKSGSLWTGVLLHGSHNLFVQQFFDPITTDTGRTKYVIGEFGAGLAIVCIFFAVYFWMRRSEVTGCAVEARAAAA